MFLARRVCLTVVRDVCACILLVYTRIIGKIAQFRRLQVGLLHCQKSTWAFHIERAWTLNPRKKAQFALHEKRPSSLSKIDISQLAHLTVHFFDPISVCVQVFEEGQVTISDLTLPDRAERLCVHTDSGGAVHLPSTGDTGRPRSVPGTTHRLVITVYWGVAPGWSPFWWDSRLWVWDRYGIGTGGRFCNFKGFRSGGMGTRADGMGIGPGGTGIRLWYRQSTLETKESLVYTTHDLV